MKSFARASVTQVWRKCDASVTQVWRKCDASVTPSKFFSDKIWLKEYFLEQFF
jgi:hypothetical protein